MSIGNVPESLSQGYLGRDIYIYIYIYIYIIVTIYVI